MKNAVTRSRITRPGMGKGRKSNGEVGGNAFADQEIMRLLDTLYVLASAISDAWAELQALKALGPKLGLPQQNRAIVS